MYKTLKGKKKKKERKNVKGCEKEKKIIKGLKSDLKEKIKC